ncbi:MAG TPA: TonB-dependent receptor [Vitreimonas sp.]|uniref:TonB-dependent receptor plug domain-containing protein n=1 Tax=Vitreimonas sp. TaxID=3069702 RepID=UPI002D2AEEB7|nr:TonB-dependent receptor [Vitreimonas sp.]HYD88308.1 TonB-dependent receptor [Vitreimonas sp.]
MTATRAPTQVERLPADVDVIDADDARTRGVLNISDALAEVAGLDVVRTGGFGQQSSLFAGGANSNHTLVLFDGLRLNDPSTPGSSFDAGQETLAGLSRIETVQGPMSAVYGSDAIGGVVNILPRRGGDGPLNARLDVAGGSFGTLTASAGADGSIGPFRYALTGEGYTTDGHDLVPERMATHSGDADGAESATFTGVFDLDLSSTISLDLLMRHREARADFDAFIFPPPSFNEQRADDADLEIAKNDLTVIRAGVTWRLDEALSLRTSGGGLQQDREEADGGALTARYAGDRRFADLTLEWRAGTIRALTNTQLVAGIEAQHEEVQIDQGFATVSADQRHEGAFITAQSDINGVTLTGAMRVDEFEGFGQTSTWRLGASYTLIENARLYAAYGTSFRAPTLYERFIFFGDPNLNPEQGSAWEAGADVRLSLFGQDAGAELGLVYRSQGIEDLIDFGPLFTYVNIDQAEIESAEARLALRPLSWLTARISYVHTDARDATNGDALLRRPEHAWSASLAVERGAFSAELAWRQVGERADQVYGDNGFYAGIGQTPSYDLLRGSIRWSITPNVETYVAAENMGDETYEPANGFAGAPASVLVGLRLRS